MIMRPLSYILIIALATLSPLSALAQTASDQTTAAGSPVSLSSQGVFSCNQTGAYAMSVGSLGAVGGTFVPVSDNAVTLNTGYLVYKECVLRPVVAAEAHAASYGYSKAELQQYLTGNNGNPYFVQNYGQESAAAFTQGWNGGFYSVTNALNSAFQQQAQVALARGFAQQSNASYASLSCPYSGSLTSIYQTPASLAISGLFTLANPACDPVYGTLMAQDQLDANAAAAQNAWETQLNWGNGNYPITDANGNVITPGALVGQIAGTAVLSGQQELANANDIGQMVPALIAGIGSTILNSTLGGLASINSSIGGQPSYLDQATQAASQQLGQQVTNAALAVLGPALSIEQQYNQVENSLANTLLQAVNQLRGTENNCWNLITTAVCTATSTASASGGATTCTASGGTVLHIATSTKFSQSVIDAQITPLANAVAQNVQYSDQALQAINTLIAEVQNTSSSDVQRTAINQLDQLVAQGLLHTQPDLTKATDQATQIGDAINNAQTGLIPQTIHQWAGDNTAAGISGATAWDGSPTGAWCNASHSTPGGPQTLQEWISTWSTTPTS